MIRTQVYLQEEQDRELRLMVASGEEVCSKLIREGVDMVIKKKKRVKKTKNFDAWRDRGS